MRLVYTGVVTLNGLPLSPPPPSHPLNGILQEAVLSPRSRETTGVSYPISLPIAAHWPGQYSQSPRYTVLYSQQRTSSQTYIPGMVLVHGKELRGFLHSLNWHRAFFSGRQPVSTVQVDPRLGLQRAQWLF